MFLCGACCSARRYGGCCGFLRLELCEGNGGSFSWTLKFLALLSIFYSIRALLLLFTCLAMGLGRAIKLHTDERLKLGENKKHHHTNTLFESITLVYLRRLKHRHHTRFAFDHLRWYRWVLKGGLLDKFTEGGAKFMNFDTFLQTYSPQSASLLLLLECESEATCRAFYSKNSKHQLHLNIPHIKAHPLDCILPPLDGDLSPILVKFVIRWQVHFNSSR